MVSIGTMKAQFKIYLSNAQINRLEQAAGKNGRRSAQAVAEEVLELYLPVWESVQSSVNMAVNRQIESAVGSNVGNIEPAEAVLAEDLKLEDSSAEVKTTRRRKAQ